MSAHIHVRHGRMSLEIVEDVVSPIRGCQFTRRLTRVHLVSLEDGQYGFLWEGRSTAAPDARRYIWGSRGVWGHRWTRVEGRYTSRQVVARLREIDRLATATARGRRGVAIETPVGLGVEELSWAGVRRAVRCGAKVRLCASGGGVG